ncbi:Hypothetical Protein FCC1311_013802 [Hondaea fermentalgiana]|uniref:PSP1 C-terminal domain-containing protein n=1 Tax=Hondaea fermentalgiana TaxID=2315210 RepID=A0A2R5G9I5_9STRA|nr:Hypothetical Protein FCC1311_013802 [Hondaea fermentalgiana]|eukprot:GBG25163.1 Hypothetical Protein FCC1311_013802 [Hondaea fermentalgiana]
MEPTPWSKELARETSDASRDHPHNFCNDSIWACKSLEGLAPTYHETSASSAPREVCPSLGKLIALETFEIIQHLEDPAHPDAGLYSADADPSHTLEPSVAAAGAPDDQEALGLIPSDLFFQRFESDVAATQREYRSNPFCVAAQKALSEFDDPNLDNEGFLASRFVAHMPRSHQVPVWKAYRQTIDEHHSAQDRLYELGADSEPFTMRDGYPRANPWRNAVQLGAHPLRSSPSAQMLTTPPLLHLSDSASAHEKRSLRSQICLPPRSLAVGAQRPTRDHAADHFSSSSPMSTSAWAPPYKPVLQRILNARDLKTELAAVERYANDGFTVIDTKNSFTLAGAKPHPSDPVIPGPHETGMIVLLHVAFKNARVALFQAPNEVKALNGSPGFHILDEFACRQNAGKDLEVVMNMDRGEDLGRIIKVEPCKLTPHIPKIPFMPVIRLATPQDLAMRLSCRDLEEDILPFCRRILAKQDARMKKIAKTLRVVDVELQFDKKRLIIFVDCSKKTEWNPFSEDVYKGLKKSKAFGLKARVWFQRRDCEPF